MMLGWVGWKKLEGMALSSLWGIYEVGVDVDKEPKMESDKAGAPEELKMRPDKQAETHEGDPNGKREGRVLA